jgi:lipid II:glycine glycyltransferase (peptidoglycan interpeptide bridge formation enzyme)
LSKTFFSKNENRTTYPPPLQHEFKKFQKPILLQVLIIIARAFNRGVQLVEMSGIEPLASCVQSRRSPD